METAIRPRSLFADGYFLAAFVLGIAVLGASGWYWFVRSKPPSPLAERNFTIVRCTECGVEHPYAPALVAERCEDCGIGVYRPDSAPTKKPIRWDRLVGFALVSVLVLCAVGHIGILRTRALSRAAMNELMQRVLYRCPFCERKISYPIMKVGSVHVCSGCKTAFTLPAVDEEAE